MQLTVVLLTAFITVIVVISAWEVITERVNQYMGAFLMPYIESDVFSKNPFATLDVTGVGQLMQTAVTKGRSTRPKIKLGICGEHGGDPDSVVYCHQLGLAYVSCSPYRVPVARLAAAQAAIEEKRAAKKK